MTELVDRERELLTLVQEKIHASFERARHLGLDAEAFGDITAVADAMSAALPTVHVYDEVIGPFYDSSALARWWRLSRQAVSKRVASGTVIACPLAGGAWVFPTWQFTREGTVDPALLGVWRTLRAAGDAWTCAMWMWTGRGAVRVRGAAAARRGAGGTGCGRSGRGRGALGSVSRDQPAQTAPSDRAVAGFSRWRLAARRVLARVHHRERGAWWFGSSGASRFDLPSPDGTCYLALDDVTAIREAAGERLTQRGLLSREFTDARALSRVSLPAGRWLADLCHTGAAEHEVTRELAVMTPYTVPHQWAAALHAAGLGGLRYQTRFTTRARPNAVAVFGEAGERSWAVDPAPESMTVAAQRTGFTVVGPPRTVQLTSAPETT